jgi:hypothetical protein
VAAPAAHPFAEQLYDDLGPALRHGDDQAGYPLLALVAAVSTPFEVLADLDAWEALYDLDRADPAWLPYLGQYVGAIVDARQPVATQRLQVRDSASWRRGTPAAIIAAARRHLTGGQGVTLIERDGGAYRLTVRTYSSQTPDPDAVEAALLAAKPAGLILTYEVVIGVSYAELTAAHATYADLDAAYPDYAAQTAATP